MRRSSPTHDQLISLQRVWLDGRALESRQAFLSLSTHDNLTTWNCTLRGVSIEMHRLQNELELRAQTIDGRTIEGRVVIPSSLPDAGTPAVIELAGLESLLIEGRRL
jgi:hypothetical protein